MSYIRKPPMARCEKRIPTYLFYHLSLKRKGAAHTTTTSHFIVCFILSHVFLACFMGLTQIRPTSPAVSSLTSQILGESIESVDVLSENAGPQSKTRQSLAIAVCESLRTTTSQDLLVGAFPLLCRLTNVENDGLRRSAGKILGQINLSEAISRERQRAEQADARARDIEEENIAMLEEIEYLQAENEELQRQVSYKALF